MPWEKKKRKKDRCSRTKLPFFRVCFLVVALTRLYIKCSAVREEKRLITAQRRRHDAEMLLLLSPARVIIKTQKAVIFRKCIQRALHMNEFMNKNDVVVSDLCRGVGGGTAEVGAGWPRRGINALDGSQRVRA